MIPWWDQGSGFQAGYEVYAVRAGDQLETGIRVEGSRSIFGGKKSMSVSFRETVSETGTVPVMRELGHELPPGTYEIEVTVRNARSDERKSRNTTLMIAEPGD